MSASEEEPPREIQRHPGEGRGPRTRERLDSGFRRNDDRLDASVLCRGRNVTPAKAGVHALVNVWIPAFAGMTTDWRGAEEAVLVPRATPVRCFGAREGSEAMDQVTVYAPGSVSNLGPGFDCLGLAFTGKGDRVLARCGERSGVRVARVSDPRVPRDAGGNTAALGAAAALRLAGSSIGLELEIEKGLPLGGGLGGSAASAVAGALAADALLGSVLSREALFEAALDAETAVSGRHGDNVAPSLLGGCVLVASLDPPRLCPVQVHPSLGLVLGMPEYSVRTFEARAVLPAQIPREQGVGQAARLGALLLGLERGDQDLIRASMWDAIAEPARASLFPGLAQARAAGLEAGALGVAVSGAGPAVVALVAGGRRGEVARALEEGFARAGISAGTHLAEVDTAGAKVLA